MPDNRTALARRHRLLPFRPGSADQQLSVRFRQGKSFKLPVEMMPLYVSECEGQTWKLARAS